MKMTQRVKDLRREARYHGQAAAAAVNSAGYFGSEARAFENLGQPGSDARQAGIKHAAAQWQPQFERQAQRAYQQARRAATLALLALKGGA